MKKKNQIQIQIGRSWRAGCDQVMPFIVFPDCYFKVLSPKRGNDSEAH